jgi:hypothetical protein
VDPKKIEETFRKVGIVIDEISDRIDSNEYDILDAKIAQDAVRAKVKDVLSKYELSIEEYRVLSGITPSPNGGLKIMGTDFTREAVRDIFNEVEKVRRDRHKVELPPSIWKPLLPLKPLEPLYDRDEMALSARAYSSMRTRAAGILAGIEDENIKLSHELAVKQATPDVAPMALADSTAIVPNSDPYRAAGKQTIENLPASTAH